MRSYKLPLLLTIMLSGCVHSSRVQMDYIGQRDECRGVAESNQSAYGGRSTGQGNLSPQLNTADSNAVLAKIFSDCMYVNGWTVATPPSQEPRPNDPATPPPPNGGQNMANNEPNGNELEWLSQPKTDTVARSRTSAGANQGAAPQQQQQPAQQMRQRQQGNSNPSSAPLQSQPVPSNVYVPQAQPMPSQAMPPQQIQRPSVPQRSNTAAP